MSFLQVFIVLNIIFAIIDLFHDRNRDFIFYLKGRVLTAVIVFIGMFFVKLILLVIQS